MKTNSEPIEMKISKSCQKIKEIRIENKSPKNLLENLTKQ
jgi:hypothetical protein